MGRPGAGTGKVGGSVGSMHKVSSGPSGSMHRVGSTVSRPTGGSNNKPTISTPIKQNSSRPVSKPANDYTSRPTARDSRPSMNSGSNMLGGSVDKRREEERRLEQKRAAEIREQERRDAERREKINRREEVKRMPPPPPPRREPERRMPPPPPPRHNHHVTTHAADVARDIAVTKMVVDQMNVRNRQTTNNTYVHVENKVESTPRQESHDVYRGGTISNKAVTNTSKYVEPKVSTNVSNNDGNKQRSNTTKIAICIAVFVVLFSIVLFFIFKSVSSNQETSYERTKLDTGFAYMNDCVSDELGWLNANKVSKGLQQFYKDTGAQPYIWLRKYNGINLTEDEEYKVAIDFYNNNFAERQDVVLYVYFEESDPTVEGNMALIHGTLSGTIMDAEAEEIFWNYLDADWSSYSEEETDEMFIDIFRRTGKSIMYHPTNIFDVLNGIQIFCSIAAVGCALIVFFKEHNRRQKEKAEETERILNTPLEELANSKADELLEKYK